MSLSDLIAVARGDRPADTLLKNARIVNVLSGTIEKGDVALYDGCIAGIGDYSEARQVIDLGGAYLAPGFIDGHVHIESSMLHPYQFARAVVPHGTTSICTDLHEITNVAGLDGIRFVLSSTRRVPLDFFFQIASCVPSTHMETAGAAIGRAEVSRLLKWRNNVGLGEMMNYPGVVNAFPSVIDELEAAQGHVIDGHAPGLRGKELNAYIATHISSDHETTDLEEGREKLSRGLYLMIREGTTEKNLEPLLPLISDSNWPRCMFVSDDRSCSDLLNEGHIDAILRRAIGLGLDPVRAIQLVTCNPARYFRLHDLGSIRPGARANLMTFTSLEKIDIDMVFYNGRLTARGGAYLEPTTSATPQKLMHSIHVRPFGTEALQLKIEKDEFPVIELIPGQIITRKKMIRIGKGIFQPDTEKDLLKAVVVERHKVTGNIGLGVVKGFGIRSGAIASTVAHDSHNIVAVGSSDTEIMAAIKAIEEMQGGLVVCRNGEAIARLPLPVCGLLATGDAAEVSRQFDHLEKTATRLGKLPPAPFALLSFIALPVIPELRLTDMGIVDVLQFKIIS